MWLPQARSPSGSWDAETENKTEIEIQTEKNRKRTAAVRQAGEHRFLFFAAKIPL
jgi:hypothetical protein